MVTTPVDTHPAKRHDVESVAAAIDFVKEVTVGAMRCVVHLQLTAGIPEGMKEITSKNFFLTDTETWPSSPNPQNCRQA